MAEENLLKRFQISCGIAGIILDEKTTDVLLSIYENVRRQGGDLTVDEIIEIKEGVLSKYIK